MQNIRLKGARNTRDLGDLPVLGGVVKAHRFLRAAHLNELTENDIAILTQEYKLSTIIDLRTERERQQQPDVAITGVSNLACPVFGEAMVGITHENENASKEEQLLRIPSLEQMYPVMLSEDCLPNLVRVMRHIVTLPENGYSVLFHCTEGKDRTGVVAMLILMLLGASRETAMQDYLFTNTTAKKKAARYYWMVRLLKRNKPAAEKLRDIFMVKESYLQAIFDAIDERYGSMDAFIEHGLGITPAEREAFRARNIER